MTDKPRSDIQDSEDWQQAKAEIDDKDLLMRQTFALEAIEQHLRAMRAGESNKNTEKQELHTCEGCGDRIPENNLESHAKSCMNWGQALGNVEQCYK